jgi:hypothetical protein
MEYSAKKDAGYSNMAGILAGVKIVDFGADGRDSIHAPPMFSERTVVSTI